MSVRAATLRDLPAIHPDGEAVTIDEVEPASELFKRFDTAAMSGALSPEATALAEAMNSPAATPTRRRRRRPGALRHQ